MRELTREEAIRETSLELVEKVEGENCEQTSHYLPDVDERAEWIASVDIPDGSGNSLEAVYMVSPEDMQRIADADCDGSVIDWEIDHYQIV